MQIETLYKLFLQFPSIQTDSRKVQKNDLYFALKGPNFNGNTFALNALQAGAAYAIVDEMEADENENIIQVNDVLETLQALAKHHRQQFTIPFIGITGSNGKTTTKELIHQVLSTTYKTYTTVGNLNNHIGVPLTILKIKTDAEIAIIEMGANHVHEIKSYCQYAMPTHGLITNCGKAHLEGFGSEENIKKAKGELFDWLKDNKGTAFIMEDYEYLKQMSKGVEDIKTYGTANAELEGTAIESNTFLKVKIIKGVEIDSINTQLVGDYNLPNVLAAVALGKYFQVEANKIKSSLEAYTPSNSRSQLIEKDGNYIILDAYNANPSSMQAAIKNFAKMEGKNKVLLLGCMKELGAESLLEHQQLINLINQYIWNNVVLVGEEFEGTNHNYIYFKNSLLANDWFKKQLFKDANILIKGSRGVAMEEILN